MTKPMPARTSAPPSASKPAAKPATAAAPAKRPGRGKAANARNPERTAASILQAAVREFAEKGYGGARIDAIAARAGSNKRMIYHYFGDKEGLYLAVLESAYVGIRSAELGLHLLDTDPPEALRRLVRFTWQYFVEHPEFLSLLHTENMHHARYLKRSPRIFELHSPLVASIEEILQRGVAAGQFRAGIDPVTLYITVASLGFFYLSNRWTLSVIFRRDLRSEPEIREWEEHIVSVIDVYARA